MLTNIAPMVLAFALYVLAQHHRRAVRRHDLAVDAWRLALRHALHGEGPTPEHVATPKVPAQLPAGRRTLKAKPRARRPSR